MYEFLYRGVDLVSLLLAFLAPVSMFAAWRFCCRMMRRRGIQRPPVAAYVVLFFTLGGWIVAFFESNIGPRIGWPNLISENLLALQEALSVYVAPFLTGWIVISLLGRQRESAFHNIAFWAAATYTGSILIMLAGWLTTKLFFVATR